MALIVADRVKEVTTTTGTGTYTLGGAVDGFQVFSAVTVDTDTVYYAITDDTDWEVGIGTIGGTQTTLARTTILSSSNAGSAVNWGAGTKNIFLTYPAEKAVYEDASGNVDVPNNLTVGGTVDGVDIQTLNTTANAALPKAGGTMTGNLVLNADPTASLQAATKQYVDTIAAAGIHYHTPARVEAPANLPSTYDNGTSGVGATLTNSGTQVAIVIDGIALSSADRVLIYQQTDPAHNGVYTVTTVGSVSTNWVLTRATDADSYGPSDPDALGQGDAFFISAGDTGAGETYVMTTVGTITFGTTGIVFTQISATSIYSAGAGLTLTGQEFSLNTPVASATALATGRTIGMTGDVVWTSAAFDGSGNVTGTATIQPNSVALGTDTTGNYVATGAVSGTGLSGSSSSEGGTFTVTSNATALNTVSAIVARDGSGNFAAGTVTAALSGNATTATALATGRTIGMTGDVVWTSASFDGSGNVTGTATIQANSVALGTDTTGNYVESVANGSYLTGGGGASEGTALTLGVDAASINTASKVVARDASGNFAAGTITAALTGNASTATTLQTARNIGGVSFNGAADINLPGVNTAGTQATSGNAGSATVLQTARTINGVSFNGSSNITVADATKLPLAGGTLTGGLNVTSGNVGIGTSSPASDTANELILQVNAPTTFPTLSLSTSRANVSGDNIGKLSFDVLNNTATYRSRAQITTQSAGSTANKYGADMMFFTASDNAPDALERMRIDSSGNVGIGTTPSAWNSLMNATQIGAAASFWGSTNTSVAAMTANAYYNSAGDYIYINTDEASQYIQVDGTHSWLNAPSGSAGTTATLTESMRIDSSGSVGIGTDSPDTTTKLTVAGAITVTGANSGHGASRLKLGQDTSAISQIRFYGADNSTAGILQFTGSSADGTVGGERMRIDSSGGLITTPAAGGHAVFNEDGVDADFRVESDAGPYAFYMDAGANSGYGRTKITSSAIYSNTSAGGGTSDTYINGLTIENNEATYTNGGLALVNKYSWGYGSAIKWYNIYDQAGVDGTLGETNSIHSQYVSANNMDTVFSSMIGGALTETLSIGANGTIVNDGGLDNDFRVESATTANALFVEGSSGDVGIGTSSPAARLDIRGSGAQNIYLISTSATNQTNGLASLFNNGAAYGDLKLSGLNLLFHSGASATESMRIASTGAATFTGDVNAPNFNTTSDATLKTNVETLTGSLDAVQALRGVSFDWIDNGGSEIGVIAQEVEAVLPALVNTNDQGIKTVKYGNMVAVLIEAVKELKAEIEELKKR
jgi:hypothetical protein